jgi:hypothetical protein
MSIENSEMRIFYFQIMDNYYMTNKNASGITFTQSQMNEWLLFNDRWVMLQLYHDENKLHFEEMMLMMSTFTEPLRLAYIF